MIVWGDDRRTYGQIAERSRALAGYLHSRQLGAFRDRRDLARWECGQDRVALLMYNRPEHVEAILGCWKARVVPCNVNYHYTADEVADLLQRIGARGVIYDRRLGEKLTTIAARLDLLIEIDDASPASSLAGAVSYERALARGAGEDRASPMCHPTTCTSRAPVAPPDTPRRCSGDKATSSSRAWEAPTAWTPTRSEPVRSPAAEPGFPRRH